MVTPDHLALLTAIAQDYYLSGMTISALANKYHVSRYYIEKYIDEAQQVGLVKITIAAPTQRLAHLESRLRQAFPTSQTFVIKDATNPTETTEHVISYAAQQIQNMIADCRTTGLAWGGTIYDVIQHFSAANQPELVFTQFMGENMKYNSRAGSTQMVEMAANKFGAAYHTLVGPLYVFNPAVRRGLAKEPANRPAMTAAHHMDMTITGIGTMASIDSIPAWHDQRTAIVPAPMLNAVAGVLFVRPYTIQGHFIAPEKTPIFGVSLPSILAVPHRVGIVTSKFKTDATLGALRGGLLTDIFMSESVANRIIAAAQTI